jgi:hypothetical protein
MMSGNADLGDISMAVNATLRPHMDMTPEVCNLILSPFPLSPNNVLNTPILALLFHVHLLCHVWSRLTPRKPSIFSVVTAIAPPLCASRPPWTSSSPLRTRGPPTPRYAPPPQPRFLHFLHTLSNLPSSSSLCHAVAPFSLIAHVQMLRIFKYYIYVDTTIALSSYPAVLSSTDDFFQVPSAFLLLDRFLTFEFFFSLENG